MRILITSDTHGDIGSFLKLYEQLDREIPIDKIVHCGDYYKDAEKIGKITGKEVISVTGNCDIGFQRHDYRILETESGEFLVTHGHLFNVDYGLTGLGYKAEELGCTGVIFGHTHRHLYVKDEGIIFINPGSLTRPRDGSGGTCFLLETKTDGIIGKVIYNK